MSEAKHTAGPWRVAPIDSAKANIRAGEHSIALVYRHLGSPTLMDHAGEGDANARLIAKAPELFAFVAEIARCGYSINRDSVADITDKARALLAEIEGKAND